MLKTKVIMYRNLMNKCEYRKTEKHGIQCKCLLTGEWYPTPMKEDVLNHVAVSYTIYVDTKLGAMLKKISTVTRRLCGLVFSGKVSHV